MFKKSFNLENDLSTYELQYQCADCCIFGGCPTHKAKIEYCGVSDIYSITWRLGEKNEYTTSFDAIQFALIEDFMNRLKE